MDSASMDFREIAWERGWSFTSLADELGLPLDEFAAFFQAAGKGA